jgi:hypothetical protein
MVRGKQQPLRHPQPYQTMNAIPSNSSRTHNTQSANEQEEYAQAVLELHREQHQPGGLWDTICTMFMWFETPTERVLRNRQRR